MPEEPKQKLKHLLLSGTAKTERYTSPKTGRQSISHPSRNPVTHGEKLLRQISQAQEEALVRGEKRAAIGIADQNGTYLEFQSEPEFELTLKSLESSTQGIELTAVRQRGQVMLATVFIPEGKLAYFTKRLEAYAKESLASGKPKNQNLIANIGEIHLAVLESFWTDDEKLFPQSDDPFWWEVWLRVGSDRQAILNSFHQYGAKLGLKIGGSVIRFLDRTVILAYATKSQMSRSAEFLDCIAELRRAKDPPGFFVNQPPADQMEWVKELRERIDPPRQNAPAVCLLDTGVNNRHLLIEPALDVSSLLTCHPEFPATDHNGHGTEMAGLGIYGDLTPLFASKDRIALSHQLESVKILPATGWNDPDLYGSITLEAVTRAEAAAPSRSRAICMAVTAADFRDRGYPSSWSAELDQMCSGGDDDERRLMFVSAGNIEQENWPQYPEVNYTDGIHDPAQAWNAVTVGAFTERIHITEDDFVGWELIAQPGALSPSSTTSLKWNRSWCVKPDIVMEGGNAAKNPVLREAIPLDDLSLLTTYWQPVFKQLVTTHGTSAAAVLAARMAAILQSSYPEYWPETIRALIIHSAEWTEAMRREFSPYKVRNDWDNLLRCYGFGVPSLGRAMWSASNSVTLVVQESLQPFFKDGSQVKTSDMQLHSIPWPTDVLEGMGEAEVEMQVTLSYFIEPSPARRGWKYRHRYASHGLRFAVKLPTESLDEFRTRINKAAREEEERYTSTAAGDTGWLLGPQLRDRGSVHSDRWVGTAGDLAHRGLLAVYPVGGWWKERHTLGRWNRKAKYSLLVSIRSQKVDLDIYTPIANMVAIPTEIKV